MGCMMRHAEFPISQEDSVPLPADQLEQEPPSHRLESHIRDFGRTLLEQTEPRATPEYRPNLSRDTTRAAWKRLELQYGKERVAVMKRLAKHGATSVRYFGTVETWLRV